MDEIREEVKKIYIEDSAYHYQMLDKSQTMAHYYKREGNVKEAKAYFKDVKALFELLLEIKRETPRWYTLEQYKKRH